MNDSVKLKSIHDVLTANEDGSDPTDRNGASEYVAHNRRPTKSPPGVIEVQPRKFFYDAQLARLLLQIGTKVFGGYQVISGFQRDGKVRLKDVPVIYGGVSRVISQFFGGISDNVVVSLPMMSYSVAGMTRKTNEIRDPQQTQQFVIRYRARDPDGNLLVNQPGRLIVIERLMPVPYEMELNLQIWSNNTDQLMQMVEQLGAVFNPDLEIALSNNPLDWTSPTRILCQGDINFQEIKVESNPDPMITATLKFSTTLRLSLPVRVYDADLIHEIDINIRELEDYDFLYFGDNIETGSMPQLDNVIIRATAEEIIEHGNQ